jgi:hypothetical protein
MLLVSMLSVVMMTVFMIGVIFVIVILNVVTLNVVMLSVMAPMSQRFSKEGQFSINISSYDFEDFYLVSILLNLFFLRH